MVLVHSEDQILAHMLNKCSASESCARPWVFFAHSPTEIKNNSMYYTSPALLSSQKGVRKGQYKRREGVRVVLTEDSPKNSTAASPLCSRALNS